MDAVHERSREVERGEIGTGSSAAGTTHRVGYSRSVAEAVQPRLPHLPDDVDHEHGAHGCCCDRLERCRDDLRLLRGSGLREALSYEREQRQRHAHDDERGRT